MKKQFCIAKHIPHFIAPKSGLREQFKCVKYTGTYGIASDTVSLLIFPSKVPVMTQNFYTREIADVAFPDVLKVIPLEFQHRILVPATALPSLVAAAAAVKDFWGDAIDKIAPVTLETGENGIRLSAERTGASCLFTVQFESDRNRFDVCLSAARLKKIFSLFSDYCQPTDAFEIAIPKYPSPVVFTASDLKVVLSPVRADWRRGDV